MSLIQTTRQQLLSKDKRKEKGNRLKNQEKDLQRFCFVYPFLYIKIDNLRNRATDLNEILQLYIA